MCGADTVHGNMKRHGNLILAIKTLHLEVPIECPSVHQSREVRFSGLKVDSGTLGKSACSANKLLDFRFDFLESQLTSVPGKPYTLNRVF